MTTRQRTAGASAPASPRNRWVACEDYAVGPFTQDVAERRLSEVERVGVCHGEHRIEVR